MNSPRRGFTLIEVLMVMALLGIFAGWAVTRVTSVRYRMDANIRMLQNTLLGAQQTAISRNVHVFLTFDAVNHRVRVLLDADNNGEASAGETVTYKGLDGAIFHTPTTTMDGAAVFYLTGPGVIETANPLGRSVRIGPNGAYSGDFVIYIGMGVGRPNDQRALVVTGATGRTAFWTHGTGGWTRRDY